MQNNEIRADLHIHSHYSRATSPDMNIEQLAEHAKIKGLTLLGTGDFTHPKWLKEMKEKLTDNGNGIYEFDNTKFLLTAEISLIYSQKSELDKKLGRRVHLVLMAPSFEVVDQINEMLGKIGDLGYDGRPIFGRSCIDMTERLMQISKDIEIIPAHAWTPWFSVFGSNSGFNSINDCFKDQTKNVHAIETGMSSDPAMNWRLSQLDDFTLVSFSDAHSPWPWRLGRECCVFDIENVDYKKIIDAIRTKKNFLHTNEVNPEYGKYHEDGHRSCGVHFTPEESKKHNNICPVCKRPLTIGVMNRVGELADRPIGYEPKGAVPFKSLLPLHEVIAATKGVSLISKKVGELAGQFLKLGTELDVLEKIEFAELSRVDEKVSKVIVQMRNGRIKIDAGYDGVYGKLIIDDAGNKDDTKKTLRDF